MAFCDFGGAKEKHIKNLIWRLSVCGPPGPKRLRAPPKSEGGETEAGEPSREDPGGCGVPCPGLAQEGREVAGRVLQILPRSQKEKTSRGGEERGHLPPATLPGVLHPESTCCCLLFHSLNRFCFGTLGLPSGDIFASDFLRALVAS